jgi:PAS domain S-box-containing protein
MPTNSQTAPFEGAGGPSAPGSGEHEARARLAARSHAVHFYESDDDLAAVIAAYVGAGLACGEAALVIATGEHRRALCERLAETGFDLERLRASHKLSLLDARALLGRVLVDGQPDRERFVDAVGTALQESLASHGRVRTYGEMVDLLLGDGDPAGALRLEELWKDLLEGRQVSLLCAYQMGSVRGGGPAFVEEARRRHGHVLPHPLSGVATDFFRAQTLREAERFRLLVENVKDYAIFMLDAGGHIASWNEGAERMKGYAEREIIGAHFSIFYPEADVLSGKCEMELEGALRTGRFEDEGWRLRKDGTRFWANVTITAVRDDAGRLIGFGKVTRDLTARIEAERERIRLARAEEGKLRREEFLAIMGHELRNPLAAMVTAVHVLKMRRGIKCEHQIEVLDRQLLHMTRLLDDVADVSRTLRDKVTSSPRRSRSPGRSSRRRSTGCTSIRPPRRSTRASTPIGSSRSS